MLFILADQLTLHPATIAAVPLRSHYTPSPVNRWCLNYIRFARPSTVLLAHYRLFQVLKSRKDSPTDVELALAKGTAVMTANMATKYLAELDTVSNNIKAMFEKQGAASEVCAFVFLFVLISIFFDPRSHGTKHTSRSCW
jgi:hypothetical protein